MSTPMAIECKWDFSDIPCEECDEDSSPSMKGGGIAEWKEPEMGRSILCSECIELHELDLHSIVLDWRKES